VRQVVVWGREAGPPVPGAAQAVAVPATSKAESWSANLLQPVIPTSGIRKRTGYHLHWYDVIGVCTLAEAEFINRKQNNRAVFLLNSDFCLLV
jgi:hypothetical protein